MLNLTYNQKYTNSNDTVEYFTREIRQFKQSLIIPNAGKSLNQILARK